MTEISIDVVLVKLDQLAAKNARQELVIEAQAASMAVQAARIAELEAAQADTNQPEAAADPTPHGQMPH